MNGKGSKWRSGHSFPDFQDGYDAINWGHKKSSMEWLSEPEFEGIEIISPDGWDKNFGTHSFHNEKITKEEFEQRLLKSELYFKKKKKKKGKN